MLYSQMLTGVVSALARNAEVGQTVFPLRVTESDEASTDLVSVIKTSPYKGVTEAGW